jgi:lysyl-tRNA synthetase class 1
MPVEIIWFFILRFPPDKQLFFGEGETLLRLFDEFSALLSKPDKSEGEKQLLELCLNKVAQPTVSQVPFSHLVASYQAALKDPVKTLAVIARTEYSAVVANEPATITAELKFIDMWLKTWAPEQIKFDLAPSFDEKQFSDSEKDFLQKLGDKIDDAPADADGDWFHRAIYEFKDQGQTNPKEMFSALYRLLIGQSSGPRAGWFLSILPRDWLVNRLHFKG